MVNLLHQFPVPVDGVRYQNHYINAIVEQEQLGKGTLYVTEGELSWISSASGEGFTIQYRKMTLHAISRDENVCPSHCLYIMLNGNLNADGSEAELDADLDDDEDPIDPDEIITEIKFVPDEPEILQTLYNAIQECTLLHPDSASDMTGGFKYADPDEDEEDFDNGGAGDYDDEDYEEDEDDSGRAPGLFGAGDGPGHNGAPRHPDQFADADDD